MKHMMVDLETLGTTPGSVVLSIGACMFDPVARSIGQRFYAGIRRYDSVELGLTVDRDTESWWLDQNAEARQLAFNGTLTPSTAIINFNNFWRENGAQFFWCHGANFDEPLLCSVYEKLGVKAPWEFWDVRCTRTIYHLAGVKPDRTQGTYHNPTDDAVNQANAVIAAVAKLGVNV